MPVSSIDLIASLLADLDTLTRVSEAGVLSRREVRLEPGETRPAAILFLDLVGFTELARVLTSQQLTTLVDRAFRIFELTVQSYGGYWDNRFGDAALYVFPGHPNYPPACEAALLASMALLDRTRLIRHSLSGAGAIARDDRPHDGDIRATFNVRIGVAFGEVTRQRVGGESQQITVMGDTVNLAQRLEAAAEPGTAQTTLRVLDQAGESLVAQYRGDIVLKGFGVVQVQRLAAVRPRELRLRGSFRQLTPLIGRGAELDRASAQMEEWLSDGGAALRGGSNAPIDPALHSAGAEAGATNNKLILIEGTTAVGKSRFAYELLNRLAERCPLATATAHCAELASTIGFAGELCSVAGLDAGNLHARFDELCDMAREQRGAEYADSLRSHLPTLTLLLGGIADAQAVSQLDPQEFMSSVQGAVKACCELAELDGRALVIVVEDMQWIGLGVLHELLAHVLSEVRLSRPLVIVATSRASEIPPSVADTGIEHARVHLAPLTRPQCELMLGALLPGLSLPATVAEELHEKAIGLPYYYEEFARMLVRRGIVVAGDPPDDDSVAAAASRRDGSSTEDGGRMPPPQEPEVTVLSYHLAQPLTELAIPEDIQMLILGRLDQLDTELRELTGRASVLGRSFSRGLLAHMEEKLGFAAEDLDGLLAQLVELHILAEESRDRYFFEHLLTQEAAYSALLQPNRMALHRVAAQVLEDQLVAGGPAEADILPELATHLLRAGLPAEAHRRACQLLSLKAVTGRFENWEQWEIFARASWLQMRAGVVHDAVPDESHALLSAQAARYVTQGRWEDALACYEDALGRSRDSGEGNIEAALLCSLGSLLRARGDFAEAESCYLRALLLAREGGQQQLEAVALRDLGTLQRERGLQSEAMDYLLRALAQSRQCADKRSEAVILDNLGMLYMDRFMADAAQDAFSQALALAGELRSPWTEGLVLGNLGLLHMKYLRFDAARQSLDRALALAREVGDPRLEGEVAGKRANLLLREGELEAVKPELARAQELLEAVGNPFQLGFVHCQWAQLHLYEGRQNEAREHLTHARRIARGLKLGQDSALTREITKAESSLEQFADAHPVKKG